MVAQGTSKDSTTKFITCNSKWVRVLAGPGAGKTFNLKKRIEYLVKDIGVKPERILVLSFTSVAAQDLRKSIQKLGLGPVEVSTLHSLALKILKNEKKTVRLMTNFEKDTMLRDLEPDIGLIKDKQMMLKNMMAPNGADEASDEARRFEASLKAWKKQHPSIYLENLIPYLCNLLEKNDSARKRSSYDWIIVDEYQDLNPDEQHFVELLLSKRGKLTVIGDDDQSIYGFKGASPAGIIEFVDAHDTCEDIQFSKCWRCPTEIVKYANRLIEKNTGRIIKKIDANTNFQTGRCELLESQTPDVEIEKVNKKIQEEIANGLDLNQIVVLTPIKSRGQKLYETMNNAGIATALCYRDAIFDSSKVRENYSLLSLAANHNDLVSWRYLLGYGSKESKARSYRHIRKYADSENLSVLEVLELCSNGKIKVEYQYTKELINRYKEIKEQLRQIEMHPHWLIDRIKEPNPQYATILERAFSEKYSTDGFAGVHHMVIDEVFSPETSAENGCVRIMSLHASKGLSASLVIILSANEDLIPLRGNPIEEQRRLFYVAITRCKGGESGRYEGKVFISWYSHSNDLQKEYQLTRFVTEMGLPQPFPH